MGTFKGLLAYKKSFTAAMRIFEISITFPKEEKYSLTDQVRRSSRSVSTCIAEAYGKRRYEKHFISKLSDADMECGETESWLDFAYSCNYIDKETVESLQADYLEIGKLIGYMIKNPWRFI